MQQKQAYIEAAESIAHTVDAANIGGTAAATDCVLYLTTATTTGQAIVQDGTAADGLIWRIRRRGIYRIDLYLDLKNHAETILTAAFTRNTNAAGLTSTPTNATQGIIGRIRSITLPAAPGIVLPWYLGETFAVADSDANRTQAGALGPGVLLRVILTGHVADTHPTAAVVGTAANWGARLVRVGDVCG